ncbi:hypothetical protein ACERK3_13860 [Phycisphaerales bacterium AB-hyl4]|uniref:Uncharacterized protein n=1 Tax=Natronomicrosphaera hydrolytica TaxID=3242702 RepID=A0ABV4U6Z5_9BACT
MASALQLAELIEQIARFGKAADAEDAIRARDRVEPLVQALLVELRSL